MDKQELTYDILRELFNISVGKAADMLSEIIDRKIVLNVPNVGIFDSKDDYVNLGTSLPSVLDGTLMVSSISFEETLTGKANLIFPVEKMRKFIKLCSNDEEDSWEMDFTDVDFDIIKEIGNIILNCIIGEIGNYLDINLTYSVPKVKVFDKIDFNKDIEDNGNNCVLLLYITFIIDDTEIEGAIIIDLTLNSLNKLIEKIDIIRDELYE
ncbi:chemotaxis protein CheC [Clostridium sp.]|uniref:chemotaxis protein CheC n=1 Tax=Clostridium sp. TaxID=1506 RepID=UPI0028477C18|nr:chemotaxis protein CheC [Clostridium sp.]MDR3598449.1 chemotaxis protein CheC [Clostridium sp.]